MKKTNMPMSQIIKFDTLNGILGIRVKYFDEAYQKERAIQLCSRQDPLEQGDKWARAVYEADKEKFIIYGIGVGYHIQALQALLTEKQQIVVLDACHELMDVLEHEGIIKRLEQDVRTRVIVLKEFSELVKCLEDDKNIVFAIYQPSLQVIPKEKGKLREILESYQLRQWNKEKFETNIKCNISYHQTQQYVNVSKLYGTQKEKPIVVVSAGPSLSRSLRLLKQIENNVFIIATGRVLKTLISNGIKVDMFCIIDSQELTYDQIENLDNSTIPFVFLNTVCERTVREYQGPKYIAYNIDSDVIQEGRLESGGSVATACIDLAIKLGGNPIILVGQDLAYTDGTSHAAECITTVGKNTQNMRQVRGINGLYYPTTESLLSFKRWIEWKVQKETDIEFINATIEGAYVEGCKHIKLEKIVQTLTSECNR